MNEKTTDLLAQAVEVIGLEGGRVLISKDDDGTWMVGMEWGKEAEDSPTAGAAAYGLHETLTGALEQALGEATGDHDPLTKNERKELYGVDRDVL